MKKTPLFLAFLCLCLYGNAQLFDKIRNKVNQKVNDAVDKATSGKKKNDTTTAPTGNTTATPAGNTTSPTASATPDSSPADTAPATTAGDFKAYSKFDFVPGDKVVVEEDFSQDAIGEFPAKWNTKTNAEVITLSNKPGKWLCMRQDGVFYPEYIKDLPDNFTLQADLLVSPKISNISTLTITLAATKTDYDKFSAGYANSVIGVPGIKVDMTPRSEGYEGRLGYSTNALGQASISNLGNDFLASGKGVATLSIWRQKQRVRVYINSTKMLDLPRALEAGTVLNSLIIGTYAPGFDNPDGAFYIGNIRLAAGAPDTRNKLITEGKFVSHGILFDVNSDVIKPQSYGAIQEIANILKDNAAVNVKIIGHTDSDGDDKLNLDLSRRRADAVKAALVSNFSIDAARLTTDGKGKTQPIDANTTPEGKANNRRVEFIKQ